MLLIHGVFLGNALRGRRAGKLSLSLLLELWALSLSKLRLTLTFPVRKATQSGPILRTGEEIAVGEQQPSQTGYADDMLDDSRAYLRPVSPWKPQERCRRAQETCAD